jgi:hypothetical protein
MNQDRTKAGAESDESVLDQAEDALVGEHPDDPKADAEGRPEHKDTGEKPFLKSP